MGVVRHHELVPVHVVHRDQIANRFLKRLECLIVIEVADMLADERLPIDYQGNSVFQVSAEGKNWALDGQRSNRVRSVAARAPQDRPAEDSHARDGIVHAPCDGTLAHQERIGHAGQTLEGIMLGVRNGLARAIGAGHHQDLRCARRKQQMMQRRVGQHHT